MSIDSDGYGLFAEDIVKHLHQHGQILSLIVRWQDNRVFFLPCRCHDALRRVNGISKTLQKRPSTTTLSFSGSRRDGVLLAGTNPVYLRTYLHLSKDPTGSSMNALQSTIVRCEMNQRLVPTHVFALEEAVQ
jgi:hypothetical protein